MTEKAKAVKKPAAKPEAAPGGTPVVLLSGGNPQIAKGYGDAPVQAYIAAMNCDDDAKDHGSGEIVDDDRVEGQRPVESEEHHGRHNSEDQNRPDLSDGLGDDRRN